MCTSVCENVFPNGEMPNRALYSQFPTVLAASAGQLAESALATAARQRAPTQPPPSHHTATTRPRRDKLSTRATTHTHMMIISTNHVYFTFVRNRLEFPTL